MFLKGPNMRNHVLIKLEACIKTNIKTLYSKCTAGRWQCTEDVCSKTCRVIGLQHFETFDGQLF